MNIYISIVNTQIGSSIIKYNKDFDVIARRDFNDTKIFDVTLIKENNKIIGFALIEGNNLITVDYNLVNDVVVTDISKYKSSKLGEANEGFILYGVTDEVKLDKGDSSYYLINYVNNEEVWETIGETPTSKDGELILLPIKEGKIKEYFLL